MSKAEELLDSLSIEDIQPFTSQPDIEGHIVIDKDRIIHVPTELKRIAVQYDANIETVTFDCPRYWDEHDLSKMNIYINYKLPSNLINNIGQSLVKNLRINEDDPDIINFDWTIGPILTNNKGDLPFSVCAKSKTNQDSDEAIRWYTEINTELTISEGMDGSGDIEDNYEDLFPDIINDIISKLDGINATYDEKLDAFNANATSKTESFDTNAQTRTTEFNNNAAQKTLDYNNNCISKIDSFNQNSIQKVTEFNDNYTSKLNSFNSNADSRIEEFDTHADLALTSIPKQDVEGTDNVFDDGLESPLYALGGDGKSEQVVSTGKNLCDGVNQNYYLNNTATLCGVTQGNSGLVIETNGIENYTVSTKINQERYRVACSNSLPTGSGAQEVTVYNGVNKDNTSDDITINTSGYSYLIVNATDLSSIQIVEGDTAKPFEPYTNRIPSPSPDYPQEINSIEGSLEFDCSGENFYNYKDIRDVNTAYEEDDNGWITLETDNRDGSKPSLFYNYFTNNLDLEPSTSYNIFVEIKDIEVEQGENNDSIALCSAFGNPRTSGQIYDSYVLFYKNIERGGVYNKVVRTVSNFDNVNDGLRSFCTVNPGTYVKITFRISVIKDTTKTTQNFKYEPYIQPNEVTFNLNDEKLRSVGDVKDELVVDLDTGDYYKVENVGEVVFDGSEEWGKSGNTSETNYVGVLNGTYLTDFVKCKFGYGIYSIVNYFTYSNNLSSKQGFQFYNDNGQYYTSLALSIDIDTVSTIEEFKQWLSTHNTIVDYVLQTPTTKKLGTLSSEDLAKLKTFKGYNNVTVNTNLGLMNIRFTYGLDIKKYVDNKIAELSAQLIKGE